MPEHYSLKTSLEHLPESKQMAIQEIRRIILNEVEAYIEQKTTNKRLSAITHIILFGSFARGGYVSDVVNGYFSDFDILVAVNQKELLEDNRVWKNIEERADRLTHFPLNLIVHTQDELTQCLKDGHYFFSDIQKEGIYLYTRNGKGLPEGAPLAPEKRLNAAKKHYAQWFESANEFLINADFCFHRESYKIAAFQLHQATERFYACILLVYTNYLPKTHNLKNLHNMAQETTAPNSPLETLFNDTHRFERQCFQKLKRAYVEARYSEHYTIEKEQLEWLFNEVERLKEMTKAVCDKQIEALENVI